MSEDDENTTVGEKIEAELHEQIQSIVAGNEPSMVLKWVCLVETMDADGVRGLWTMTSPDVQAWDTAGLLQHGLHLQQMAVLAHAIQAGSEE